MRHPLVNAALATFIGSAGLASSALAVVVGVITVLSVWAAWSLHRRVTVMDFKLDDIIQILNMRGKD